MDGSNGEEEETEEEEGGSDRWRREEGWSKSEGWSDRGDLTDKKQERGCWMEGVYRRHPLSSYM